MAWTGYLGAGQMELFQHMSPLEQRHALEVLGTLQRQGHSEPALAQAALLHDAGKTGGRIRVWHRVLAVMLQSVAAGMLWQIARDEPGSWRYPFFVQLRHASRGAHLAMQAGADARAIELIRWHHTPPHQTNLDAQSRALLAALRSADDQN
jgi:hypothetical protein